MASSVRPNSSGSVIGVLCRYRTLGFSIISAAPVTAAVTEPVTRSSRRGERSGGQRHRRDRDRDARCAGAIPGVQLTGSMLSTCGSGSQTAPICCQPGVRLSRMRARDDEVRARVVMGEREAEPRVMDGCGSADDRGRRGDIDRRARVSGQDASSLHFHRCRVFWLGGVSPLRSAAPASFSSRFSTLPFSRSRKSPTSSSSSWWQSTRSGFSGIRRCPRSVRSRAVTSSTRSRAAAGRRSCGNGSGSATSTARSPCSGSTGCSRSRFRPSCRRRCRSRCSCSRPAPPASVGWIS